MSSEEARRAALYRTLQDAPAAVARHRKPPDFETAKTALEKAVQALQDGGIVGETLVAILVAELVPRMIKTHGPEWTARTLQLLGSQIAAGLRGARPQ